MLFTKLYAASLIASAFAHPWQNTPQVNVQRRSTNDTTHTISPSTLVEFPNPTWLENFAIRPNGQLVITLISKPEMYIFDPIVPGPPIKLFGLPGYLALLGIVEFTPDVFYFVAGNFSTAESPASEGIGSYSIFKIDLRVESSPHAPTKILDMPKATFLNGLELLSKQDGLLVVTDSGLGLIWEIDIFKREYKVLIDAPELKIASDAPPNVQLGVNGVHIRNGFLYFTNTSQGLFCRVPITPSGSGYEIGAIEILASAATGDDFTLDRFGNAWITQGAADEIALVVGEGPRKGDVITVAGSPNTATVAGTTRCAFGRMEEDRDILYVVTNGGLALPPNGVVVGGKVLALDTRGYLAQVLG